MRQPILVWEVVTDRSALWRKFRTFEEAERFARKVVAASAADQFADSAMIHGPGDSAWIRLDGAGRVWTDLQGYPA